jgi:hypothetical protein
MRAQFTGSGAAEWHVAERRPLKGPAVKSRQSTTVALIQMVSPNASIQMVLCAAGI